MSGDKFSLARLTLLGGQATKLIPDRPEPSLCIRGLGIEDHQHQKAPALECCHRKLEIPSRKVFHIG